MRLYDDLAEWWPLLSAPADYAEEAAFFRTLLDTASERPPRTVLELGSGGGNNACHLKVYYAMTLVDLSPHMLAVSRALNPECEHLEGDMRTVRLGHTFDAVFVHDAICYMTTQADLRAAMRTAFAHCREGGAALFVPDHVRENFSAQAELGGHDAGRRGLRFMEWTCDPDPADSTYVSDFAVLLREESGDTRVVHDRHTYGLFARADWLAMLRDVGFTPEARVDEWGRDLFIARRPHRA